MVFLQVKGRIFDPHSNIILMIFALRATEVLVPPIRNYNGTRTSFKKHDENELKYVLNKSPHVYSV